MIRYVQRIETARDVELFRLDNKRVMVISCDSSGAIGPKPLDHVKVDGATVGKFTARVALMETMSIGAEPICLSVSLCVEPSPTGLDIVKGIRRELRTAGFATASMVQSSEKNFLVQQTGVGVAVTGIALSKNLRVGNCRRGDTVLAIGTPLVGLEVVSAERANSVADLEDVCCLLDLPFVHEIMPVGSTGILKEARVMAAGSQLRLDLNPHMQVDVKKSAGPATVLLCSTPRRCVPKIRDSIHKPLSIIGELRDASP